MQTGDILLVSGKSIISKIIRKITGSKWTHTAIYLQDNKVLEIDWHKRAMITKNIYTTENGYHTMVLRTKTPLTLNQKKSILTSANFYDRTGSLYDFGLIIALLIRAKFPSSKIATKLNDKNFYICTELTNAVYKEAGIELIPNQNGDIYPHEFLNSTYLKIVSESTGIQDSVS